MLFKSLFGKQTTRQRNGIQYNNYYSEDRYVCCGKEERKVQNWLEEVKSGMVENAFLPNRSKFGMFRECACNSS